MNAYNSKPKKLFMALALLLLLLVLAVGASLLTGPANAKWGTEDGNFILMHIRLPRILLAFLVGAALSLAGAGFQALLRNPLADPHLLGVSAGGALGVVIGSGFLMAGSLTFAIPVLSLAGSFLAMLAVYRLSLRKGVLSLYTLVLIGVMLNSLFISTIVFLQSMVRSDELMTVLFWLLGNLSFTNYSKILMVAGLIGTCMLMLFAQAKKLNLISLGESAAHALGVSVERTKKIVFLLAALLTGTAVSVSGMIGFIGLVVPHLARILFGSDYRILLPVSAFLGGVVLILADTLARVVLAPQELPVGVITSLFGAPFFIYFLKQREGKRVI